MSSAHGRTRAERLEALRPERGVRDLSSLAWLRSRWVTLSLWLELTRNLAVRDIETRYKHSLLGLYWAIVNPLVTAALFGFVFGVIFHAVSKPIPYVIFLLTGLTFWNFFANSVQSATTSITGNAAMLAKLYFPRLVLPTASVLARVIDLGFSLLVLAAFIAVYRVPVYWTALWIVPLLGFQGFFTLGVSYLVASLNVLYRDMTQLAGLVLIIWMWLSPIMYPVTGVPNVFQGLLLINPMGGLLQAERDLLFAGHLTYPPYLWVAIAWSEFVFVSGLCVFKHIEPVFAEVM